MKRDTESLGEANASVDVPTRGPFLRRWWAVAGPALMVAVGYTDPSNWATDLAQASRQSYPKAVNIPLYVLAEVAITATDLAEVIGSAIAFELLFGMPLLWGVVITTFDVLLLMVLSRFGIRKLEAVVLAFVGTIGAAFLVETILARPDWHGLAQGFVPSMPDGAALYVAIGILGATVMPHNLYLHSALVQTRRVGDSPREREALTILYLGEGSTGALLVLSQVVLSLQLPFAVIPLIHFVSDRERMGALAIGLRTRLLAWLVAGVIVVLNVALVIDEVSAWLAGAGAWAWLVRLTVLPVLGAAGLLLLFVTLAPLVAKARAARWAAAATGVHTSAEEIAVRLEAPAPYRRVAVALDFHGNEERLLNEALRLTAGSEEASITLMHVVESPAARAFGARAADFETQVDRRRLQTLCDALARAGHRAELRLGLGGAVRELARMINEAGADAVLLGSHGHRGLADVIHGTTADALRHRVSATVVIVPGA